MKRNFNETLRTYAARATLAGSLTFLIAWGARTPVPIPTVIPTQVPTPSPTPSASKCEMVSETMDRVNGPLPLPAKGRLVTESHLVTTDDDFKSGVWPSGKFDKIQAHMDHACEKLNSMGLHKGMDCTDVYTKNYDPYREWTPAEGGGNIGSGSSGTRPSLECEMWTVNFYWRKAPKMGTRWLITNPASGKSVVACAGAETGPGGTTYIGGAQREALWSIGATGDSQVITGRLKDQSLPLGPVNCK